MIVWTNRYLRGDSMAWKAIGGKKLLMFNNIGRVGKRFEQIYLTYRRDGQTYIVSLNRSKIYHHQEKTVGIWVCDSDYTLVSTGEMWTGTTTSDNKIIGRFGIYNVGTVIIHEGRTWELKLDKGWVITANEATVSDNFGNK